MKLHIDPQRLKLREPFVTGTRTYHARQVVRISLEERGRRAIGEAAPLPGFSAESAEEVATLLNERARELVQTCTAPLGLAEALAAIGTLMPLPSARFAAETLLLSWRAQAEQCTVPGLFGDARRDVIEVNVTIPSLPPAQAALRAEALRCRGYRTFKVKLGVDLPRNCALLEAVRRVVGEDAEIRGDANGCWDSESAERQLRELARYDLAYIEQPLPVGKEMDLPRLRGLPVPVALDESLRSDEVLLRALAGDWAEVFVLKPTVIGGFVRTREMAARVMAHGKRFVVTTALAGATERRACFDLACVLPGDLPACGLNTAGFIDGDTENDGLCIEAGRMVSEEIERHERAAL